MTRYVSDPEEANGLKPGDRVEIFEVPGGYVIAPPGALNEELARHLADVAAPTVDAVQRSEPEVRIDWEPRR